VGKTPAGFYDASGNPIAAKFTSTTNLTETAADLTASDLAVPATASAWVKDGVSSSLNPAYTGSYPNALNYGWYSYYPTAAAASAAGLAATAHLIGANSQNGTLLRGGEGSTYARFHLLSITYADTSNASSAQTWTFHFDVQP
ncbi:MAG: hypothetical protein QM639_14740, partial [Rhodocyclaceae bacterium]